MDRAFETVITIASGIIGVAILAVLVSNKANTAGVLGAAGSAFSNALSAATGPVTGSVAAPVNSSSGGAAALFGNFQLPNLSIG